MNSKKKKTGSGLQWLFIISNILGLTDYCSSFQASVGACNRYSRYSAFFFDSSNSVFLGLGHYFQAKHSGNKWDISLANPTVCILEEIILLGRHTNPHSLLFFLCPVLNTKSAPSRCVNSNICQFPFQSFISISSAIWYTLCLGWKEEAVSGVKRRNR